MRRRRLIVCFRVRAAAGQTRPEAVRPAHSASREGHRAARCIRHPRHPLRRRFVGFGQLHGPGALLAGVDLEEAGAVKTARQAILGALDGEFLVARTHECLSRPFAAPVVIQSVDIIKPCDERAAQQRLAAARGHVPPAFGGPALGILVAERDADPAGGVVAEAEVRRCRTAPQARHRKRQRRDQTGGHASGKGMAAVGISCDHLVKLYQILDDFAHAGGDCQRLNGLFRPWAQMPALCALLCAAIW